MCPMGDVSFLNALRVTRGHVPQQIYFVREAHRRFRRSGLRGGRRGALPLPRRARCFGLLPLVEYGHQNVSAFHQRFDLPRKNLFEAIVVAAAVRTEVFAVSARAGSPGRSACRRTTSSAARMLCVGRRSRHCRKRPACVPLRALRRRALPNFSMRASNSSEETRFHAAAFTELRPESVQYARP